LAANTGTTTVLSASEAVMGTADVGVLVCVRIGRP
jgi:hypothetical protein